MTYAEYTKARTTRELREELKALDESIFKIECFGVRDLFMYDAIAQELQRRKDARHEPSASRH